jgi:hypothetical protein
MKKLSLEQVAHAYDPSNSGGRDQEDCSLKPVQENSSQDPISTKMCWWRSGSRCRPCVQAPYWEKKIGRIDIERQNLKERTLPSNI